MVVVWAWASGGEARSIYLIARGVVCELEIEKMGGGGCYDEVVAVLGPKWFISRVRAAET